MAQGNGGNQSDDPTLKALHEVVVEVHGVATEVRVVATELRGTNARLDRVETVLLETRQELRETNARLGKVEAGLDDLRGEMHEGFAALRGEMHEGFAELGQKIDSAADRDRHLEQSVQQLGERVAKLEARESR